MIFPTIFSSEEKRKKREGRKITANKLIGKETKIDKISIKSFALIGIFSAVYETLWFIALKLDQIQREENACRTVCIS